MVVYFLSLLLLLSTLHCAPFLSEDYYELDDSSTEFVEKSAYSISVFINTSPSAFFPLLPSYLSEVSSVLDLSTTISRDDEDKYDQIFVVIDDTRVPINQEESLSSSASFVEVVLEIDTSACISNFTRKCFSSNEHLIELIGQANKTFPSVSTSPIIHPSSSKSHFHPILIVLIPLALVSLIVLAVVQTRRSAKKRTRIHEAVTWNPPSATGEPILLNPITLSVSPSAKRRRPGPDTTVPPPSTTILHAQASGAGPIRITINKEQGMVNTRDESGRTPLHCLVAVHHAERKSQSQILEEAQVLLSNGACVNARDNEGNTPIHLCISHSRLSLMKLLLTQPSIDVTVVNEKEETALHIAASINDSVALDFLMEAPNAKAMLNMTNFHNYTPLVVNINCFSGPSDTMFAQKLLEYGADVNYVGDKVYTDDNYFHLDRTALHYVASFGMDKHIEMLVLNYGATIDAVDRKRRTPLHLAAEENQLNAVKTLVKLGANWAVRNHNEDTAADVARRNKSNEIADYLDSLRPNDTHAAKKGRRGTTKEVKEKKQGRRSTDTGYQSEGAPLGDLEEDEEGIEQEIVETPVRPVQPRQANRLFNDEPTPIPNSTHSNNYNNPYPTNNSQHYLPNPTANYPPPSQFYPHPEMLAPLPYSIPHNAHMLPFYPAQSYPSTYHAPIPSPPRGIDPRFFTESENNPTSTSL